VSHHSLWLTDLPKIERPQVFQFSIGDQAVEAAPTPPPISPAIFQSFKRDGSIDWQLKIDDSFVSINCLSYSRWDAISRQAKSLFEKVLGLLLDDGNRLQNVALQYIDSFIWFGDIIDYDVDYLFNRDSGFLPEKFKPTSPFWHYHVGEFEYFEQHEIPRRILDRVHMDAVEDANAAKVRIDTLLRAEFRNGADPTLSNVRNILQDTFDALHLRNKSILSNLICRDLQQQISLNKEG